MIYPEIELVFQVLNIQINYLNEMLNQQTNFKQRIRKHFENAFLPGCHSSPLIIIEEF